MSLRIIGRRMAALALLLTATLGAGAATQVVTLTFRDAAGFSSPAGPLYPGDEVRWDNQSVNTLTIRSTSANWSFRIVVAPGAVSAAERLPAPGGYGYQGEDASPFSPYASSLTVSRTPPSPSATPRPTVATASPAPTAAPGPKRSPTPTRSPPASPSSSLFPQPDSTLPGAVLAGPTPSLSPVAGALAAPSVAPAPTPGSTASPGAPQPRAGALAAMPVPARGRGLPDAVAAVLVLGVLAGFLRVVADEGSGSRRTP
ncbi:MAG: hypothetical protein ACYDB7_13135 [Mycobacteriales bacterium]